MKKIAIVLVSILFAACATTPKPIPPKETTTDSPVITNPAPITSITPDRNADIESRKLAAEKLAAELQALQEKSVYFDFDKYAIKPEYLDVIRQQAEFIKAHKNDFVTVEGNCDERGSSEYNLALGDRRANAARKSLELLGVPATQIRTISLGEEKPRLLCHAEKCWQENRRDDFVHKLN